VAGLAADKDSDDHDGRLIERENALGLLPRHPNRLAESNSSTP